MDLTGNIALKLRARSSGAASMIPMCSSNASRAARALKNCRIPSSPPVSLSIGPVKARFTGKVTLSDLDPPNGYKITGEGQGRRCRFRQGWRHGQA